MSIGPTIALFTTSFSEITTAQSSTKEKKELISDDEKEIETNPITTILSANDPRSETEKDAHLFALFFPLMSDLDKANNIARISLINSKEEQATYLNLIQKYLDENQKQEFETLRKKYMS